MVEATSHLPGVQVSAEWARNSLGEDSHGHCFHCLNKELLCVSLGAASMCPRNYFFAKVSGLRKKLYILSTNEDFGKLTGQQVEVRQHGTSRSAGLDTNCKI